VPAGKSNPRKTEGEVRKEVISTATDISFNRISRETGSGRHRRRGTGRTMPDQKSSFSAN